MSMFGDIFKKKPEPKAPNNGAGSFGTPNSADNTMNSGGMSSGNSVSQNRPISQPIDPDEFFARPERKPKPKAEEPREIDTSAIEPDTVLRAEGEAPAVNYDYSKDKNKIETDSIDADQVLRGEGEVLVVQDSFKESATDSIDPNQYLRGEGEAPAVNYDYSQDKNKIETDNIDPNQFLRGEGEAPAINYDFSKDNNSISTEGVDTDTLQVWEEFASAAAGSADSE